RAPSQRRGRPPPAWTRGLWPSTTARSPIRARSGGDLAERVRRAEDYAALGARVVVELHTKSHAANPPPAPGRSPAAPSAPTTATSTASSAASVTAPAGPSAPA